MNEVGSATRLGPLKVSAARKDIEAFCRETGWPFAEAETRVPHTFPMRWLASPEFRAAIEKKLRVTGGIAIHEAQTFTYEQRLETEHDYMLNAELESQKNPDRLILRASIVNSANEPLLQLETILRLVGAHEPAP
jgi:hypothetical protein